MTKRKGLGRGLGELGVSELLGGMDTALTMPNPLAVDGKLQELNVTQLKPGVYQPRQTMDPSALEELANSIRAQGIIQPIVVRRDGEQYEIIAGERRWRAAQKAGLTEVPVVVRSLSDQAVMAIALIENIQRQDLNAIEEAMALNRLIDEFNMTHQEVASAVGRSRASVTNLLRLLKLHPDVRAMVENQKIDMGHARALLALNHEQQLKVALVIVDQNLSVRKAEEAIQNKLHPTESPASTPTVKDPNVLALERNLSEKLGAQVDIQSKNEKKGKIVITYHSLEELDGILEHIQ